MPRVLAVLLFAAVALPAAAYQSTGSTEGSLAAQAEKVKRERAARRAASGKSKSFTNDDLKGAGGPAPSATPDAGAGQAKDSGAGGAPAKSGMSDDELQAKRAEIQKKIDAQKKRIEVAQKAIEDAQRELGDLTNYTFGGRRASLEKTVADGNVEVTQAQKSIADLEEEARRLGASASR
jgi:hypothetical protein